MVTAVILALIVGNIVRYAGFTCLNSTVSLLFKKITTLFSMVATPLVFCAVITGISGIGDAASFGKIGGRLIGRMMITYFIAMTIMVLVGIPMGLAALGNSSSESDAFTDLLNLVLDMIPENLISPFAIDNDLQVIVLAIFIGVAMLLLGDKANRVKEFISGVGEIVNKMMMLVCKLLPVFVFLGICDLIISDRLAEVAKVSSILLISFIASIINILIVMIRTRIVTGRSLKEIFAPQIPSFMINLTTSSQISALPESMKCCKEGYKIDEKLVDFGLPLGIVVYMPNGAIMLGAMTWVLGTMSHGPADPMTIFKIIFVSIVVAIAAPPIPGSAFAIMPILFSACGTDLSMMPLAVIVASTFGYLLPAMNGFCLQEEILMAATKADMIKIRGKR
ncbi:MAG: cation:dicarboxylase symporter family transporter [Butyrivibrio sp.]|uniref:dicarboxylate/amino acid:cation symporter n=1 Tax=Butyrivibrio sp. TaxID=28121 RepID=UPI001B1AA9F9|nr:cation:dicarboxylase symporter family transporter [Butyrivibrio sp.]MBO6242664.1 cation:dicarboxylase symporter family transporter [Butyrivibrio sp.]